MENTFTCPISSMFLYLVATAARTRKPGTHFFSLRLPEDRTTPKEGEPTSLLYVTEKHAIVIVPNCQPMDGGAATRVCYFIQDGRLGVRVDSRIFDSYALWPWTLEVANMEGRRVAYPLRRQTESGSREDFLGAFIPLDELSDGMLLVEIYRR